jgi:CRP-like cAMP-binding protein
VEHRQGNEQRDVVRDADRYIEFMKKIPLFQGLTPDEYKKILHICSKQMVPKDHFLCRKGDESNELYILIKGQLKIMFRPTSFLTYISPIGLVGEIGVFTGVRRTASVLAVAESSIIRISKIELFELFRNNSVLGICVLLNVIADLSNKLQEDNELIEELRNKKRTRIL